MSTQFRTANGHRFPLANFPEAHQQAITKNPITFGCFSVKICGTGVRLRGLTRGQWRANSPFVRVTTSTDTEQFTKPWCNSANRTATSESPTPSMVKIPDRNLSPDVIRRLSMSPYPVLINTHSYNKLSAMVMGWWGQSTWCKLSAI